MRDRPAPVGACGRAELLWALRAGGATLLARTADLLGFEERPIDEESSRAGADSGTGNDLSQSPQSPSEPPEIVSAKIRDAQFWRLESYEPVAQQAPESEPERAVAVTPRGWTNRPLARPAIHVLAPWPELRRRLRPQLTELREGPEPDLERLVGRIGCGLLLERLPRLRQRRLGPALQLVFDRSERLVPFWSDQDQVAGELARLLAAEALTRAVFHEGLTEPRLLDQAQAGYRPPAAGGVVLVLGDLGSLAATGATDLWLRIGRRIAANGCRPVALVPCRRSRVPEALRRLWCILPWERPPGIAEVAARALGEQPDDRDVRRGRARRLLALLAPAVRIEPGLLRAVRLCLADPVFDAAVEADCWQGPAVASTHSEAATLNPRAVADLRTAFATETLAVRRRVLALLRTWRGHLPKEIWYEEILNLAPDSGAVLLDSQELEQDLEDARRFFGHLCAELTPDPTADTAAGAWVRRMSARATAIWRDEVIGTSLVKLDWAMHRHRPDYRPPIPIDPAALPAPGVSVRRIALSQVGFGLSFHGPGADRSLPGSPLAIMETSNRLVDVTSSGRGSQDPAFWESGEPPRWAHAWGWDQSGAWVDFAVAGSDGRTVTQRMRWVDLGTFPMGSPKDESERYSDEGPQRRVRIERGFWLFDTAVSQALWEAVKGDKPSYVKGLDRPVEQVSWEDCQDFIARVNVLKPGLALALPSEAQWEYACRAGTDTPFSFGANITPEQVNYDGDAPYAGAERGLSRGETVPVGSLPANAWGLYEMHGNVREWVQDTWHDNYEGAPTDENAWESTEAGAVRVIRGGSWGSATRGAAVPRSATGAGPASASTTSASVVPEFRLVSQADWRKERSV